MKEDKKEETATIATSCPICYNILYVLQTTPAVYRIKNRIICEECSSQGNNLWKVLYYQMLDEVRKANRGVQRKSKGLRNLRQKEVEREYMENIQKEPSTAVARIQKGARITFQRGV